MKIVDKILSGLGYAKGLPMSYVLQNGMLSSLITKSDALDFYKSWVYACVSRRSQGFAQVNFRAYQLKSDGSVEEVMEHELLNLLYKFNPEYTKFDFLQLSVIYHDLLGASPWILEKTNPSDKYPSQIWLARPEHLKVQRNKDGVKTGYTYQLGGYSRSFEPNMVIDLKNPNPTNPDKGVGIIEAVRLSAQNDDFILQSNNNLLQNDSRPSGYLTTEFNLDKVEAKRLKKEFKKEQAGYKNTGEPMIMGGGLKFEKIGLSPRELEYLESRKMNRDEILSIFGVPKPVLGVFEDVNRASATAAEYVFAKWTLEPLITKYIEQLNEFLVPMFGDNLWLDFDPIAKSDAELELKRRELGWNKWMTTNEVRELDGLPAIKGGDYIYMPLSNLPLIGGTQEIAAKMAAGEDVKGYVKIKAERANVNAIKAQYIKSRILNRNFKQKKAAEKIAAGVSKHFGGEGMKFKIVTKKTEQPIDHKECNHDLQKKKTNKLTPEQRSAFYAKRMAEESGLESMWKKEMGKYFEKQKERFLAKTEEYLKSSKALAAKVGIDQEEELKSVIEVISPLYYATVMAGVQGAAELLGESAVIDMDFIKGWLEKVGEETGKSITETTIASFTETLTAGIENGESLGEIKNRIGDVFEFATEYRSEMIARTETARAVTEAHREAYEFYGFEDVEWLLSPDACEVCASLSGDKWTVKTINGQIPVHPNCKCDFTPL